MFTWHQWSLELNTKSRTNECKDLNDCLGIIVTLVTTRSPLEITRMIAYIVQRLNIQYESHILSAPETTFCCAACVLPLVLTPYYHISTWSPFKIGELVWIVKLSNCAYWKPSAVKQYSKTAIQLVWSSSRRILIQGKKKNHKDHKNRVFDPQFESKIVLLEMAVFCFLSTADLAEIVNKC